MPEANVISHFPTVHLIIMGDSFKTFAVFYISAQLILWSRYYLKSRFCPLVAGSSYYSF